MKMPGLLFCNVSKTVSIKCKQKREEVLAEQEKWCTLDDLIDLNIVRGVEPRPVFLWLGLRCSSTARLHHLLMDHLD